jgi:isopentenyl-diphosphate delta-isomerase
MNDQQVILVNEQDEPLGSMEKMEAHRKGELHRAFSVFIFNSRGEMLLQQRALKKYHSGGLWTNACCSHPRPGETNEAAALRRLREEMGFDTPVHQIFSFTYKASFSNGLTEHEYDHVFAGIYDGAIQPDPEEVQDFCFKNFMDLKYSMETHPDKYTYWFQLALPKVESWVLDHFSTLAVAV